MTPKATTWKQKYNKRHCIPATKSHSITDIARTTGIKRSILQKVYNRGIGAWKTNPQSVRLKSGKKAPSAPRSAKMGKEQWAMARIYSFVGGGGARKADADLWRDRKK